MHHDEDTLTLHEILHRRLIRIGWFWATGTYIPVLHTGTVCFENVYPTIFIGMDLASVYHMEIGFPLQLDSIQLIIDIYIYVL